MGLLELFNRKQQAVIEPEIVVEITDLSAIKTVEKTLSFDKIFSHGYPMELFTKQVTRPYENIASVFKAIKALCDNVPQARLKIYNLNEEEVEDQRLQLLLNNPNPKQSFNDFIQEWVGFYALYGEGFIKKVSSLGQAAGLNGLPARLINLDPSKVSEIIDYSISELTGWKIGPMRLDPEEIIHTKDFNPYNQFRGMSPLKPIDDEIEIDQSSLTFNNAFFKNNATIGLLLATDNALTDTQRQQLLKFLEARHNSTANAFKSAILEKGVKPVETGRTHKDMEFIEQKRLMREEILGTWRAPKALFNITEDLNYATFMGQMRIFWLYALMPIMRKFEDSINFSIIMPYNSNLRIGFDYSEVPAFQEDFKERVATGEILSRIGFTGNEINDKLKLGFENKPWRDKWWVSFGLVPAEEAEQKPNDNQEPEDTQPEEDNPQDQEEQDNAKGILSKLSRDERKTKFLGIFLKSQGAIEDKMERKFSRYLMDLRAKVLKIKGTDLQDLNSAIDWRQQDEQLIKMFTPLLEGAVKEGITIGQMVLGRTKDLNNDNLNQKVSSFLQVRADKLIGINSTIRSRLTSKLQSTLEEQISQGASLTQQTEAMHEAVRSFFNFTADRARLVARTESAGAVNGGSMLYYENEGVGAKEWVTSHDDLVRPSHVACERQGAIPMERSFSNGLEYPGDQSNGEAGEVCNCRCSILPIIK